MITITNDSYHNYQQNKAKQQEQQDILSNNYTILVKERSEIESIVRQYSTLTSAYKDETEIVSSNYTSYIVLLIIAIILILIFFSISFSVQQRGGAHQISLDKKFLFLFFLFISIYILSIMIQFY